MAGGHGDVHVIVAFGGDDAAARGAGEEAELDEVGFVHFFDGTDFFTDDGGDGLDASRTTAEFLYEGTENMMIGRFGSEVIDFEGIECFFGGSGIDGVVPVHLGIISNALQNTIRDARGLTAGSGDDIRALFVEFDTEYARRSFYDSFDFAWLVKFETMDGSETVAEGIGEGTEFGRGTDEGELRKVELERTGGWSFADDDVELVILHRGIEYFLDGFVQPMNLVDEEDITGFEVGEYGSEVADFLDSRAGSDADIYAHFFRDDIGERCLPETGGSVEEDMLDIFSTTMRRLDEEREIRFNLLLTDILREGLWAERIVENDIFILFVV